MHRKQSAFWRLFLALTLAPLCALCAAAAPLTGTLTLHCHYGSGADAVPLAGDTYALVAVADAETGDDGSLLYTTKPEFQAWDRNWAGLNASQWHDAALQLQAAVQDALPEGTPTGTTDADGDLTGSIEIPALCGLVGGGTKILPAAKVGVKILGVQTAAELAQVIAAVGLAQNFAAMRALATDGIQKGHMKLHARNIATVAGATGEMLDKVVAAMVAEKNISVERAKELLSTL